MPVSTREARERILEDLATAIDRIGIASASLGAAYERLDEATAERLEGELFRPVQRAFGRAKRTRAGFAERVGLSGRPLEAPHPGAARSPRELIEQAVSACRGAGETIAELQDSMLPIEAGDAELRTGLAEVRELIEPVSSRARELLRGLGR